MAKRGGKAAVATFRARISRAIPVNAIVDCADNSGVLQAKVIGVFGLKTRKRRIPTAAVYVPAVAALIFSNSRLYLFSNPLFKDLLSLELSKFMNSSIGSFLNRSRV